MTFELMLSSLFVLLISSAWDFPALIFSDEIIPNLPTVGDLYDEGSWHHQGTNFWIELLDTDTEWWTKLIRFVLWWTLAYKIARRRKKRNGTLMQE